MIYKSFFDQCVNVREMFRGYGSFGLISGELQKNAGEIFCENELYRLQSKIELDESGVFTRQDAFKNISNEALHLHCLHSRFTFQGGEYEVYTQSNAWQAESMGSWQELVTSVRAVGSSTRTAQHAAPFVVLWSKQQNRGVAFHLMPGSAWEMSVTRISSGGKYTSVVVDMGILERDLDLCVAPGEILELPKILCYEVLDRVSLDCWKLHAYMNKHYPRREMPIIYNSWLYRFTDFDYEIMKSQVAPAAQLGAEYFVIDAGWFGDGRVWVECTGDWKENTKGNFAGRMAELARDVRAAGMKFGIWMEPERAGPETDAVLNHKEYYVKGDTGKFYFLDFANEQARSWMLDVITGLVEKYGVAFIKDDYNADLYYDVHHSAFLKYQQGHEQFIKALRQRHPELYLSGCGAGGMRMELSEYTKFDSTWPTDNCSPYRGLRIYKDTLLRRPPQGFEKVLTLHSLVGYDEFYKPFAEGTRISADHAVACGDAIWKHVEGVTPSFLKSYMTGGPVVFSCDLTKLSAQLTEALKDRIEEIKKDRSFWMQAAARILCDTPTVVALQYNNGDLSKVVVQLFTLEAQQRRFTLRPCVDAAKTYLLGEDKITSKQIMEEGITVCPKPEVDNWREAVEIVLTELKD
jgi:hypothetical protein